MQTAQYWNAAAKTGLYPVPAVKEKSYYAATIIEAVKTLGIEFNNILLQWFS